MPLLIRTDLKPSNIHGLGVFTREPIIAGQIVWKHDAILDGWIHKNLLNNNNDELIAFREYVDYLYPYDEEIDCYIKSCDNMNRANHSYKPSLIAPTKYIHIASRDLNIGDELTVDYREICDLAAMDLGFTL